MTNTIQQPFPAAYHAIEEATQTAGFTMASDPLGHQEKALQLVATLEAREDLLLVKQHRATGIIIAVKK